VSSFMSDNVSRWDDLRADWRFTAGLFFVTVLLETAAFGQLTAFTPLYLRQVIGMPEEEIPSGPACSWQPPWL
jgi:hypothetical protein